MRKMQEFSLWTLENTPGISPEDIEALGAFTGNVAVGTTIVAAIAAPWVFGLVMAVLMKIYAAISAPVIMGFSSSPFIHASALLLCLPS
jgi:hypothetical protein